MSSNISFYPTTAKKQNWIQLTIEFTIDTVQALDSALVRVCRRNRDLVKLKKLNSFYLARSSKSNFINLNNVYKRIDTKLKKSFILFNKLSNLRYSNFA